MPYTNRSFNTPVGFQPPTVAVAKLYAPATGQIFNCKKLLPPLMKIDSKKADALKTPKGYTTPIGVPFVFFKASAYNFSQTI